jgi:hypothetical protein
MKRSVSIALAGLVFAGCSSDAPAPTAPLSIPVVEQAAHAPAASPQANGGNYGTPLSPDEEVMPANVVNTSTARGNATFQLSADGQSLSYKLIVANIENVFQAHIHQGAPGGNGPVVVWLFPSTTPGAGPLGGGRVQGVIAEGTITAANFVGLLAGQPMSALVTQIQNGNTYVNVHTNDGIAPTNTGPGDYPGGEVRGKVEHRGH